MDNTKIYILDGQKDGIRTMLLENPHNKHLQIASFIVEALADKIDEREVYGMMGLQSE